MRFVASVVAAGLVVGAAPAEAAIFGGQVTSSTIAGVVIGDDAIIQFNPYNIIERGMGSYEADVVVFVRAAEFATYFYGRVSGGSGGRGGQFIERASAFGDGNSASGEFLGSPAAPTPQSYSGSFSIVNVGSVSFAGRDLPSISAAIPEPATWAMMIAGFGLLGGTMRRRPRYATSSRGLRVKTRSTPARLGA